MAYGNPGTHQKKMYNHNTKTNSTSKAAEGVKTPYKGFIGQRQAYKITGRVVGLK